MKILFVALFTVLPAVSGAGCAGKGKEPIHTRG